MRNCTNYTKAFLAEMREWNCSRRKRGRRRMKGIGTNGNMVHEFFINCTNYTNGFLTETIVSNVLSI